MKRLQIAFILLFMGILFSCEGKPSTVANSENADVFEPKVDPDELQSDFMKWWTYHSLSISLASDFVGLDENSDTLSKSLFLEKLTTGKYIPLRLKSESNAETYKLFALHSSASKEISSIISNETKVNLKYFQMEGQPLPSFDFIDLKGNQYSNENMHGKTLILKTWFIGCKPCVAEFPELNELVGKYKKREDLVFLSLALDQKAELDDFLKKKRFDYQVVADQKNYVENELNLRIYPTHLIVDQNGNILKVFSKASEMIAFLKQISEK